MKRTYGLTGQAPEKPLSGQAKVIFDGMTAMSKDGVHEFLDAKAWTELLKGTFKTRQDEYRVVLYYLLTFKKRGLVASREVEAPAPAPAVQETPAEVVEQSAA